MSKAAVSIQPFGYYLFLTGSDHMHYGYWPPGSEDISLSDAQERHTSLLHDRIKGSRLRILDVGCGLGASTCQLHLQGHEVIGIAPSSELIGYAREHNSGPDYIDCGFLTDHPQITRADSFDLIIFQESLQYFPDLDAVFSRVKQILRPEGRVIICDEVSRDNRTRSASEVHSAIDIETAFSKTGFFVRWHKDISTAVAQTTTLLTKLFRGRQAEIRDYFGEQTDTELCLYIEGWERTEKWYYDGSFGYEVWELQPSSFTVGRYEDGDEKEILQAFGSAFNVSRSVEHWPLTVIVRDRDARLAAHFSAYPVPFYNGKSVQMTQQVGDTFTVPAFRGEGRGETSLLARAVRLFRRSYCENTIEFYYGFNTGKIQRFGSRFLDYIPAGPVYEQRADSDALKHRLGVGLKYRLLGYRSRVFESAGVWADQVLEGARPHYSWMINRSSEYLNWRYTQCPDKQFTFLVVYRWGSPVGWLLLHFDDQEIVVGDALFAENDSNGIAFAFASLLRHAGNRGMLRPEVSGWFSENPGWWNDRLKSLGFTRKRQRQDLDFCLSIFSETLKSQEIVDSIYYTKGDPSDRRRET